MFFKNNARPKLHLDIEFLCLLSGYIWYFSSYFNPMQCNAIQYNTIQCNAMQYNTILIALIRSLLGEVNHQPVADSDIRNIRKCECQIFDRQNLSCEILRNHEKVDRIMHLVAKLSDFWLFHPGFFSLFYNRIYLSSHLCEADSLSTSEALICILVILNVYGSVTKRLRSSSASCECFPQCLPQKAY